MLDLNQFLRLLGRVQKVLAIASSAFAQRAYWSLQGAFDLSEATGLTSNLATACYSRLMVCPGPLTRIALVLVVVA